MSNNSDQISVLPGLGNVSNTQFAGYVPVTGEFNPKTRTGEDESLFYWFVGTGEGSAYANKPTIIWTNGGPGSSSFWGFFLENGPYEIVCSSQPKLAKRKNTWSDTANYMIFEHPLSVMLSFANKEVNIPLTVEEGIEQYYQALVNFIHKHPEIANNPIILAGESYAGTYLPMLSKAILDGNASGQNPKLNLKATVLLDAWVAPYVQMAQDTTYAYMHGMISAREKKELDERYEHDLPNINEAIQRKCGLYMTNIAQQKDPKFDPITEYLNREDVRQALHIESDKKLNENWSLQVSKNYQYGVNESYVHVIKELLDRKLQVLVISGLNDAKDCNFLGTEKWLEILTGSAAEKFNSASTEQWRLSGNEPVLGYIQNERT